MELFFNKLYRVISRITLTIFIIMTLASIIIVPLIIYLTPEKILENYTKTLLIDNNLGDINYKIVKFSTNKLIIKDINFNDKEKINLDSLAINYDISNFPKININYIKLDKFHINAETNEENILSFGKIIASTTSTNENEENQNKEKGDGTNKTLNFLEKYIKIHQIIVTDSYINLSSDKNKAYIPFALKASIHKDAKISELYKDMRIESVIYESKFNLHDFNIPSTGYITTDISLKGEIPIHFENNKPLITDGILKSHEKGKILFRSTLPNNNPSMDTLIKSLSNYNYKTISIDLNSDKSGDLTLGLSIDGNNNDMYGERNIELNVNLSVNIFNTMKSFLDVYDISEGLESRFLSK